MSMRDDVEVVALLRSWSLWVLLVTRRRRGDAQG